MPCSRNCVISKISRTTLVGGNPNVNPLVQAKAETQTTGAIFQITSSKVYVPVVTFYKTRIQNNNFLEQIQISNNNTIQKQQFGLSD